MCLHVSACSKYKITLRRFAEHKTCSYISRYGPFADEPVLAPIAQGLPSGLLRVLRNTLLGALRG